MAQVGERRAAERAAQRSKAGRGRRISAAALVLLAATLVLPAALWPTASRAAETGPFHRVGELSLDARAPVLSDPAHRRMLVITTGSVDTYDPYSLKKTASLSLAPYTLGNAANGLPQVYAWTPGQARLYLLVYGASDPGRQSPYLAVVNPAGPSLESVRPVSLFTPGIVAQGMSYYAPTNVLYVLGQDPSSVAGANDLELTEVDVAKAAPTWAAPFTPGASCQKAVSTNRQAAVHRLRGSSKVYFGCGTGNLVFAREPGLPGLAEVDVSDPAHLSVSTRTISGSYALGESAYDDAAGRIILVSAGANVPAQAAWIFDEAHDVVTGVVAAGNINVLGIGIDPVGARLYLAIDGNMLVGTDRGLVIPQATQVPMPGVLGTVLTAVDFAHRLVVDVQAQDGSRHTYVFASDVPDYQEPPPDNPDAATANIPETPGTSSTFGGDAKAYGTRVHQVAGVNGALQNVFALQQDYWALTGGRAGLNDGDRDAYFARTIRARLGQQEASGSGVNVDGDANTQADYTRDYAQNGSGQKWPYTAAACADLGAKAQTATAPESQADCDAGKHHVKVAVAHANSSTLPADTSGAAPVASFGGSDTTATLDRDTKGGMVVDTVAVVRDVLIAGVAHFGRITSHARSVAHGRSGTATATYERTFENVSMPGFSCSTDCDPVAVVAALNRVLPPAVVADLPAYELVRTPKGARGAALRDPWQHQQDIILNNDGETDLEVPALRVTYYGDNAVRSRLILEFAASEANSAYAVYRVDDFNEVDSGGDLASLLSGDNVVNGLPPSVSGGTTTDNAVPPAFGPRHRGLGRLLGHGLRLVLTGRRALLLNALLWSLLALPAFIIGRRRYLLKLIGDST